MSRYKLTFQLKQHTPMIHFQSDQRGATIRASELKPKLDRFLIEHAFENRQAYEPYLIDKTKKALNYKVKIVNHSCRNNIRPPGGAYFGRDKAISNQQVEVTIITFEKYLKEMIEQYFEEFMVYASFGARSNKGFGSFSLQETTQERYEEIIERYYYTKVITRNDSNPIRTIKHYYQELKSGIGDPQGEGIYRQSKLMRYFQPAIVWEKRWIKKKLYENRQEIFSDLKDDHHIDANFDEEEDREYRYIRALLGMGYRYEFITKSFLNKLEEANRANNNQEKIRLKKEARGLKLIVRNTSLDNNLKRFKSPITFKVFENTIYIAIDRSVPIHDYIFDKRFQFTAFYAKDSKNKDKHFDLGVLKTPSRSDFDILDFLDMTNSESEVSP